MGIDVLSSLFTGIVMISQNHLWVSDVDSPARVLLMGISRLGLAVADWGMGCHGWTLALGVHVDILISAVKLSVSL